MLVTVSAGCPTPIYIQYMIVYTISYSNIPNILDCRTPLGAAQAPVSWGIAMTKASHPAYRRTCRTHRAASLPACNANRPATSPSWSPMSCASQHRRPFPPNCAFADGALAANAAPAAHWWRYACGVRQAPRPPRCVERPVSHLLWPTISVRIAADSAPDRDTCERKAGVSDVNNFNMERTPKLIIMYRTSNPSCAGLQTVYSPKHYGLSTALSTCDIESSLSGNTSTHCRWESSESATFATAHRPTRTTTTVACCLIDFFANLYILIWTDRAHEAARWCLGLPSEVMWWIRDTWLSVTFYLAEHILSICWNAICDICRERKGSHCEGGQQIEILNVLWTGWSRICSCCVICTEIRSSGTARRRLDGVRRSPVDSYRTRRWDSSKYHIDSY